MSRRSQAARLVILFLLFGSGGLRAVTLSLSIQAGVFLPRQKSVRDCYRTGFPAGAMSRVSLGKNFGVGAGFNYLNISGQAVGLQEGGSEYPLRLRIISVPVFAYYRLTFNRLSFSLAGGAGYHSYREQWKTLPLEYEGKKLSPHLAFFAEVRIRPGLSLLGAAMFDDINTGRASLLARSINLGGVRLMAGVSLAVY